MGNSKRSPLIFIIMVLAGVVVISLGFVEIQFPEILPFSLVSAQPNVSCVGVDCVWILAGQSSFDGSPLSETIPLDVFDTSKPIIVNFLITTNSRPSVCISFVDDNGKVDVEINKIDSMGVLTTELIRTINEGSTDISADLQGKEFWY